MLITVLHRIRASTDYASKMLEEISWALRLHVKYSKSATLQMPCKRQHVVAVITGASSGIGRATALEFASRGIAVVLTSRRRNALNEVADECSTFGVRSLVLAADIADENSVQRVARQAFREFGHLDIWVNNAVVGLYGDFERIPPQDFRRVIETDFFGYVNGARAVLPYFRQQGCGVVVNVASVLGKIAIPHMSSYVAAKHAIVGFSDALRQELRGTAIRVCTILPWSIDTPFYVNAGNYTGREIHPVPPVVDPRRVAIAIVDAVEGERDRVFAPSASAFIALARAVFPVLTERIANFVIKRFQIGSRRVPSTPGNLYRPNPQDIQITGGWKQHRRAGLPLWPILATAAAVLATGASLQGRGHQHRAP